MPVVRVTRAGVRSAPREVPTDTTATVLPMTFDRVGQEANEDEAPTKVSTLAEAFQKFKPALDFKTTVGEEGTDRPGTSALAGCALLRSLSANAATPSSVASPSSFCTSSSCTRACRRAAARSPTASRQRIRPIAPLALSGSSSVSLRHHGPAGLHSAAGLGGAM